MRKRKKKGKAESASYADAVADILEWVENPEGGRDFELERNRIPDEIDSD